MNKTIITSMIMVMIVILMPYSALGKAYADESETLPLAGTVGSTINHDEDRFVITVSTSNKNVATASIGTVHNGFTPVNIQCVGPGTADITMKDSLGDSETDSIQCTAPTSIPDFPFSFSLVIIFGVVAVLYIAIRQKMMTNFKPF